MKCCDSASHYQVFRWSPWNRFRYRRECLDRVGTCKNHFSAYIHTKVGLDIDSHGHHGNHTILPGDAAYRSQPYQSANGMEVRSSFDTRHSDQLHRSRCCITRIRRQAAATLKRRPHHQKYHDCCYRNCHPHLSAYRCDYFDQPEQIGVDLAARQQGTKPQSSRDFRRRFEKR